MTPVLINTFPSDDRAFALHVARAHERIGRWDAEGVLAQIRFAYPAAIVSRAAQSALLGGASERWYVFRDGNIRARSAGDWADDDSLPRAVIGVDGRYLDANLAAIELFGVTRDEIIGRLAGSFTTHEEDDAMGERLLEISRPGLPVASTAVVKRPDGEAWPIEFVVQPAGKDGHIVTMRRIAAASDR